MAHAEHTVTINAPLDKVFAFVADGENNPKWRDAVISIKLRAGESGKQGADYAQMLKGPGGGKIDGSYIISQLEPNRMLEFQVIAGPARPVGTFTVAAEGDATKLTFTLDLVPQGIFMKLMQGMIQKTMDSEVANLDKLKQVLEPNG